MYSLGGNISGGLRAPFHGESPFPFSYFLTFSQGKGLIECFWGRIKIKSPPTIRPTCSPAARLLVERVSEWPSIRRPPSLPSSLCSLFFLFPLYSHSHSFFHLWTCKLYWMRVSWLPSDFEFRFPRGTVIRSPLTVLVLSYGVFRKSLSLLCALEGLVSLSRINTSP